MNIIYYWTNLKECETLFRLVYIVYYYECRITPLLRYDQLVFVYENFLHLSLTPTFFNSARVTAFCNLQINIVFALGANEYKLIQ